MNDRTLYQVEVERTIADYVFIDAPADMKQATVCEWVKTEAYELLIDADDDVHVGMLHAIEDARDDYDIEVIDHDQGGYVAWAETLCAREWRDAQTIEEPDPKAPIPGQVDIFGGVVSSTEEQ